MSSLRDKGFVLAHNSRVQSAVVKSRWQVLEAAGNVSFIIRQQRIS